MSSSESDTNAKIMVALRAARAAIGWNQEEFSKKLGVAKSTVARVETLELMPKGNYVVQAMRLFKEAGIEIDLYAEDSVPMTIGHKAINEAVRRLVDPAKRRADRQGKQLVEPGKKAVDVAIRETFGQNSDAKKPKPLKSNN